MMLLRESDKPRTFESKVAEYVQKPAWPVPKILKDQIKVSNMLRGGRRVEFAIRQGAPMPFIYTVLARVEGGNQFEELVDYDHIGPFSTDDWTLEITGWEPRQLTLRVGIEPFEIQTDRVVINLR